MITQKKLQFLGAHLRKHQNKQQTLTLICLHHLSRILSVAKLSSTPCRLKQKQAAQNMHLWKMVRPFSLLLCVRAFLLVLQVKSWHHLVCSLMKVKDTVNGLYQCVITLRVFFACEKKLQNFFASPMLGCLFLPECQGLVPLQEEWFSNLEDNTLPQSMR